MTLIEKKSEKSFILHIKVKPNAKNLKVIVESDSNYFQINLTSKPIQNRANKELLKLLKKKLKINANQIHFVSGIKSKSKIVQITFNRQINENEILKEILK